MRRTALALIGAIAVLDASSISATVRRWRAPCLLGTANTVCFSTRLLDRYGSMAMRGFLRGRLKSIQYGLEVYTNPIQDCW